MYIYDTGVIHGRFQVFHNDHLKYILAAKRLARHLYIGITNPDPNYTKDDPADPKRSSKRENPLTFYERYEMIKEALLFEGIHPRNFSIVPLPINIPELFHYYCPKEAVYFISIYDAWGEKKLSVFKGLGLRTYVLWKTTKDKKGISASDVRGRILRDEPWEHLVPPPVARLVHKFKLKKRLEG